MKIFIPNMFNAIARISCFALLVFYTRDALLSLHYTSLHDKHICCGFYMILNIKVRYLHKIPETKTLAPCDRKFQLLPSETYLKAIRSGPKSAGEYFHFEMSVAFAIQPKSLLGVRVFDSRWPGSFITVTPPTPARA